MQCCGTPVCIDDIVKWLVIDWGENKNPVDVDVKIDYCYELHSADYKNIFILQGIVAQIDALYTKYKPSTYNSKILTPVSSFIKSVENADGWDEKLDGTDFDSYIVLLKDINIRSAEETEVTFR